MDLWHDITFMIFDEECYAVCIVGQKTIVWTLLQWYMYTVMRCISIGMVGGDVSLLGWGGGGGGVIGINIWNHAMLQMFDYRLTFASKLSYLTRTIFTMYCCIRVHHYNTTNAMQSNQSGSINHSVLKTQIQDSNNSKYKENSFHNIGEVTY